MFHRIFHAGAALALAAGFASPALADQAFPATLAGHAMIPAATYIPTPADAPADLKTPGKFTSGRRAEVLGSVMGMSFERPTGIGLPMPGQPIQGHSGIKTMPDGSFWVLTDNGFGSRANSPDVMLYLNHYRIDWTAGTLARLATIVLPDRHPRHRLLPGHRQVQARLQDRNDRSQYRWSGTQDQPYRPDEDR